MFTFIFWTGVVLFGLMILGMILKPTSLAEDFGFNSNKQAKETNDLLRQMTAELTALKKGK